MKKGLGLVIAMAFLCALVALPLGAAAAEVEVAAVPVSFDGVWDSPEWGMMGLSQMGNQVFGVYLYRDGQIQGTVEGRKLTFQWWESVEFGDPYESADPSQRGDGYLTMTRDGNGMTGEWRYEGSGGWDGGWTASLVLVDFTGRWDSPEWGAMTLEQGFDTLTGTYVWGDGQFDGTVVGRELTYRWWQGMAVGVPYEAADPGNRGDGYFLMSDDGQRLTGEWRYEGSTGWDGKWTANRSGAW